MQAVPLLKLRLMLKGRPIQDYGFNQEVVIIGRDPTVDIRLDNMGVSRSHARITRTANGHYLEDLGSANGTFLNGHAIDRAKLNPNDTITVGKFTLMVTAEEAHADPSSGPSGPAHANYIEGTTVLTRGQLARVMALAQENQPVPPELELAPRSSTAQEGSPGLGRRALYAIAIVLAFIVGTVLGAALR